MWTVVYMVPITDFGKLLNVDSIKLIAGAASVAALSLPIGFLIHQTSVTIFNPFYKKRFLGVLKDRAVYEISTSELRISGVQIKSSNAAYLSLLSRSLQSKDLDVEYLREELSNRYSYYYARMEIGIIVPLILWPLSYLIYMLAEKYSDGIFNTTLRNIEYSNLIFISLFMSTALLLYVPKILSEIDEIEVFLLRIFIEKFGK